MRLLRGLLAVCLLVTPLLLRAQLNTEQIMIIGRNALYFEDYVLSIQYFNKVISARPYLHEPYFFRALAKYNLDDYKGAEADLSLSIERNPYVSRSYQLRGLCRAGIENFVDAERDFRMAIKYDPQNPILWQNLAVTAIKREQWDAAASIIDSLLIFSPRNTDAYLMRTQVAVKQQDTTMVRRMIAEALKCDKYSPEVHSLNAMLLADEERYEEAEAAIDRAIELMPGRSSSYLSRALIRYYRNNLRGAMDDYDMVLYIDPMSFYGYYNRGLLRMQVGDDNRAIEDFDKVLDIDPDNTMARFNRALLRNSTGDYTGAIDDFTRVLEDFPSFEYGYHCRAEARRSAGDKAGAEADEMWILRRRMAGSLASADNQSRNDSLQRAGAEKVRRRSDRNVSNYNKMVVADDEPGRQYTTTYRGKVQNRNIHIELLPMFAITYYERPRDVNAIIRYYKPIDDVNRARIMQRDILLTNNERALSEDEVKRHFAGIDEQSKNVADFPDVMSYRVARALDFYLVQDFDASLADLNIALTLEGDTWLLYFIRATVRAKQIESQNVSRAASGTSFAIEQEKALPNIDYRLAKNDLDAVIAEMPDFIYAYYNRANISAKLSDFKSAVVDYTAAIELDDKFAEAYYNRGLAKIYLGQIHEGIADLGKAGELGIFAAYNVIKRFAGQE